MDERQRRILMLLIDSAGAVQPYGTLGRGR